MKSGRRKRLLTESRISLTYDFDLNDEQPGYSSEVKVW